MQKVNDPNLQALAASIQEKLKRFYSELNDDERYFIESRLEQATKTAATPLSGVRPDIDAPIFLVINNSNKPLVVTDVDTSRGAVTRDLFKGASPKIGDVIAPGERYGFMWIEYFFGSDCDITMKAQDGSGTVRTRTGMNMISGWGYGCDNASGSLACANPGTDHPSWNNNVEVIDS